MKKWSKLGALIAAAMLVSAVAVGYGSDATSTDNTSSAASTDADLF